MTGARGTAQFQVPREAGAADARRIAELSLALRNLSFTLSQLIGDDTALEPQNLTESLYALHRQVTGLSARLDDLSVGCRTCLASGPAPGGLSWADPGNPLACAPGNACAMSSDCPLAIYARSGLADMARSDGGNASAARGDPSNSRGPS